MITIVVKDEGVQKLFSRLQKRLSDLRPVMSEIGEIVQGSIQKNFETGGRPVPWAPLKASTIAQRTRKKKWPGRILVRTGVAGGLMGGISYRAFNDRVEISANKEYAATHQFGAKKGAFGVVETRIRSHVRRIHQAFGKPIEPKEVTVKAHTRKAMLPWGDIPARPFMMVQDADFDEIRETMADHLIEGTV